MNVITHMRNNTKPATHLLERQTGCATGRRENGDVMRRNGLLMTEALQVAYSAPDIRNDRVTELREQIATGAYQIDNLELAKALIGENPGLFTV